ncbi:MAG: hypothetical protein H6581_12050 [Bacteroidia bacterium]|nr:hypothetical protein [Bacteroidia bacterium]
MKHKLQNIKISVWGLALGYFAFYVPYSALTKALSKGLIPGAEPISGFEMLPSVVVGTNLVLLLSLTLMGWWKHAGRVRIMGLNLPFASNKWTFWSGMGTAFIILTTTLAYSFEGISIVFAALLMRGGVLVMSPVIDTLFRRKVHWYSWVALGLSLCALFVLFAEKGGFALTLLAAINIGLYLSGYIFRLQFMTHIAKSSHRETNYRFFVEEMLVAMVAIMVLPVFFPLVGFGNGISDLWSGWAVFAHPAVLLPALLIGGLYGCLYLFGSRIYLNHRENTFCIPINRCASLLAGVTASLILTLATGDSFVTPTQLISAGILVLAILFLSAPAFMALAGMGKVSEVEEKLYIFVCPGNTGRSPMAQAICMARIEEKLLSRGLTLEEGRIRIVSAGINPKEGSPLSEEAGIVLKSMGIEPPDHISSRLTAAQVKKASMIFCMDTAQKKEIIGKFSAAALKCNCLDPEDNLPNPHGNGLSAYQQCAERISLLINYQIENQRISLA